jgi:hypothetical protein
MYQVHIKEVHHMLERKTKEQCTEMIMNGVTIIHHTTGKLEMYFTTHMHLEDVEIQGMDHPIEANLGTLSVYQLRLTDQG